MRLQGSPPGCSFKHISLLLPNVILTIETAVQLLKVNPGGVVIAPTGISITPSLVSALNCWTFKAWQPCLCISYAMHAQGHAFTARVPLAAQMSIFPVLHVLSAPAALRTTRVGHLVSDP